MTTFSPYHRNGGSKPVTDTPLYYNCTPLRRLNDDGTGPRIWQPQTRPEILFRRRIESDPLPSDNDTAWIVFIGGKVAYGLPDMPAGKLVAKILEDEPIPFQGEPGYSGDDDADDDYGLEARG